jgi:hypothetical protein
MATTGDYEESDFEFIRTEIFPPGWAPPSSSSPEPWTWFGIAHVYSYLVPPPEPSTDTTRPSMFAAWRLVYDEVEGDYGGQSAPVRYGRLIVERYLQKGLKGGQLRLLRTALLDQLQTAPDEPLGFDVQEAKTVPVGFVGPWLQENLVIPFCGG